MHKYMTLLLLMMAVAFSGCQIQQNEAAEAEILVALSDATPDKAEAFQAVMQCDTIKLVYPQGVALGPIRSVCYASGVYVITDTFEHSYGFDSNGSYICQYGGKGEAPMEYTNLSACNISPSSEVVICDSYRHRFLYYDLKTGKYLRSIELPPGSLEMAQQFEFLNNSSLVLGRYLYNNRDSIYALVDLQNQTVENFANVVMATDNVGMPVGNHSISVYEQSALYLKPFSPIVYKVENDRWLEIETNKAKWDEQKLASIRNFSMGTYPEALINNVFAGYTDIYELKDWLFLRLLGVNYALVNKKTWKATQYDYVTDQTGGLVGMPKIVGAIPDSNLLIGVNSSFDKDSDEIYRIVLK